jgi:dihydroxyacetone kinase-like protein
MTTAGRSQHEDVSVSAALHLALIERTAAVIAQHADELTRLDRAIGDGDHGVNLRRGFEALAADREALAALAPGDALHKAGMTRVRSTAAC